MSHSKKNRIIELQIVEMSVKGNGIGYYAHPDGTAAPVEVPFAIPGDTVQALLLRKRGGLYHSLLKEILVASPQRQTPRCIHFSACGGCRWQQIAYDQQLQRKEAFVKHCFAPLLSHRIEVRPIVPCLPPWQYRNKMEFSFSANAAKDRFLGLVLDSSRGKVFNLTECHLVNTWFAEGVKAVRQWWQESALEAYHPMRNTGSLRTLTLREGQRTGDRMAILTVSGNPDYALNKKHLESFVAYLRDAIEPLTDVSHLSIFLRIQQIAKGTATNFYEMHLHGPDHIRETLHVTCAPNEPPVNLTFKISPTAFFQPNTRQAEKLYSLAIQLAGLPEQGVVYDLYCGTGTLGICAAQKAKHVIGIELSPESSLDARTNAAANAAGNVEILCGSVPDILDQMRREGGKPLPDLVMVDPPRAGLDPKAIRQLVDLKPATLLYISCNPVTQAENVAALVEAGYRVKVIQPVDQFPQTTHVENIVVLERASQ